MGLLGGCGRLRRQRLFRIDQGGLRRVGLAGGEEAGLWLDPQVHSHAGLQHHPFDAANPVTLRLPRLAGIGAGRRALRSEIQLHAGAVDCRRFRFALQVLESNDTFRPNDSLGVAEKDWPGREDREVVVAAFGAVVVDKLHVAGQLTADHLALAHFEEVGDGTVEFQKRGVAADGIDLGRFVGLG